MRSFRKLDGRQVHEWRRRVDKVRNDICARLNVATDGAHDRRPTRAGLLLVPSKRERSAIAKEDYAWKDEVASQDDTDADPDDHPVSRREIQGDEVGRYTRFEQEHSEDVRDLANVDVFEAIDEHLWG